MKTKKILNAVRNKQHGQWLELKWDTMALYWNEKLVLLTVRFLRSFLANRNGTTARVFTIFQNRLLLKNEKRFECKKMPDAVRKARHWGEHVLKKMENGLDEKDTAVVRTVCTRNWNRVSTNAYQRSRGPKDATVQFENGNWFATIDSHDEMVEAKTFETLDQAQRWCDGKLYNRKGV